MCLHRVPQRKNPPGSRSNTDELAREQWCCYTASRKSFEILHLILLNTSSTRSHVITDPAIPEAPLLSRGKKSWVFLGCLAAVNL